MLDIIIIIIRRRPRDPHQVLRLGLRLQRHSRHRIPPVLHHFLSRSLYLAALSRTPAALVLFWGPFARLGTICRYFVRDVLFQGVFDGPMEKERLSQNAVAQPAFRGGGQVRGEAIDRDRGAREPPCRGEAGVGAGVGVGVGEGGPQGSGRPARLDPRRPSRRGSTPLRTNRRCGRRGLRQEQTNRGRTRGGG